MKILFARILSGPCVSFSCLFLQRVIVYLFQLEYNMASPDRDNRFGDRRQEDSPRGRSPRGGSRSPMSSRSPRGRSPSPRGNGSGGKILHVSGLSQRTRDIDLENKFAKYGKVLDCKVVRDKRSGMGRGYAFVTMETDQQVEDSIAALHKSEFEGHTISVERARRSRPRTPGRPPPRNYERRGGRYGGYNDRPHNTSYGGDYGGYHSSSSYSSTRYAPYPPYTGGSSGGGGSYGGYGYYRDRRSPPRDRRRSPSPPRDRRRTPSPPPRDRRRTPSPPPRGRSRSPHARYYGGPPPSNYYPRGDDRSPPNYR